MGKTGRPSKYNEQYHPDLIYWMSKAGLTDKQMYKELVITEKTLNNWKNTHDDFLQSLKKGKEDPDDNVEVSLYQRALGYEHKEDKIFNHNGKALIVPTIKHYPPDATSMIFWLKNRRPETWRDKQEIEHSGELTIKWDGRYNGA